MYKQSYKLWIFSVAVAFRLSQMCFCFWATVANFWSLLLIKLQFNSILYNCANLFDFFDLWHNVFASNINHCVSYFFTEHYLKLLDLCLKCALKVLFCFFKFSQSCIVCCINFFISSSVYKRSRLFELLNNLLFWLSGCCSIW